jgi:hypothetical protein
MVFCCVFSSGRDSDESTIPQQYEKIHSPLVFCFVVGALFADGLVRVGSTLEASRSSLDLRGGGGYSGELSMSSRAIIAEEGDEMKGLGETKTRMRSKDSTVCSCCTGKSTMSRQMSGDRRDCRCRHWDMHHNFYLARS